MTSTATSDDWRIALLEHSHADFERALARLERAPDAKGVHGARVATRRLRAVLGALRDDVHPLLFQDLRFDLKNVGRSLGALREATVRRGLLRTLHAAVSKSSSSSSAAAWDALDLELAVSEKALRTTLQRSVRSKEWSDRLQRIHEALHSSALLAVHTDDTHGLAARAWRRSLKRIIRHLEKGKLSPGALHKARLAAKQARYLGDTLGTLLQAESQAQQEVLDCLRKLQNILGELNDMFQLRGWLDSEHLDSSLKHDLGSELERRIAVRLQKVQKLNKPSRQLLAAALGRKSTEP